MNVLSKGLTALALVATVAISSIVPTQAQSVTFSYGQRDRVITSYCDRNPRDRDCRSYHGGGWRDARHCDGADQGECSQTLAKNAHS